MHIILLILGEVWSKGSNHTSLLFVDVFSKVGKVNVEAKHRQKHCRGSAEAKCIFV